MKTFTYRNIEISVELSGRGQIVITGDKKYEDIVASSNNTEILDFCDEDTTEGREARRSAYNILRATYFLNK